MPLSKKLAAEFIATATGSRRPEVAIAVVACFLDLTPLLQRQPKSAN